MQERNGTQVSEFILLGFSDHSELEIPLFFLFLLVYLMTLTGNLGMIVLIQTDPLLQLPMYFFLSNLAFIDICYSSTIIPRMLHDLLALRKAISYMACAIQLWFFSFYATTECFLLAAMAYDRFVAICNPLVYPLAMARKVCLQLLAACYLLGLVTAFVHASGTFRLSFCGPNEASSFYCDIPPLLRISCSDNSTSRVVLYILSTFVKNASTTMVILISNVCILAAILRIRSSESRCKAFSTCTSHLTVVSLFYGTIFFMYLQPSSSYALQQDKVASLFYTVVIPMLNPLIYSLRNKEVQDAFWRVFRQAQ
uniref:Olfactory receptor n=1 Tax=Varanus komodoensis TaxID=61221 RepID=A0A8D2LI99_VARKO